MPAASGSGPESTAERASQDMWEAGRDFAIFCACETLLAWRDPNLEGSEVVKTLRPVEKYKTGYRIKFIDTIGDWKRLIDRVHDNEAFPTYLAVYGDDKMDGPGLPTAQLASMKTEEQAAAVGAVDIMAVYMRHTTYLVDLRSIQQKEPHPFDVYATCGFSMRALLEDQYRLKVVHNVLLLGRVMASHWSVCIAGAIDLQMMEWITRSPFQMMPSKLDLHTCITFDLLGPFSAAGDEWTDHFRRVQDRWRVRPIPDDEQKYLQKEIESMPALLRQYTGSPRMTGEKRLTILDAALRWTSAMVRSNFDWNGEWEGEWDELRDLGDVPETRLLQ